MAQSHNKKYDQRLGGISAMISHILPDDAFFFDSYQYPVAPGCYLMKDRRGTVIYVGKAKNLRNRLASYFQARRREQKIERMVRRIRSVEVILVNNEWESLVLENNLIKFYQPYYNARLKADYSGYFYIVQTAEKYPRLLPYMRNGYNKEIERIPGSAIEQRYGPYFSRRFRDLLLEFVIDHFGIRTCIHLPKKVCLRYEIRRCCGICAGMLSAQAYHERLAEASVFLSYDRADIVEHTLSEMKRRMQAHANRLEFESAKRIYEKIEAMERLRVKQIVERHLPFDQDVICFAHGSVLVMHIQKGAVLSLSYYQLDMSLPDARAAETFLIQQYHHIAPQEIIVNLAIELSGLEKDLHLHGKNPTQIRQPDSEEETDLMALCKLNLDYRLVSCLADPARL